MLLLDENGDRNGLHLYRCRVDLLTEVWHNNYEHMLKIPEVQENKRLAGRPVKWRKVGLLPRVAYFKPTAVPLYMLEEVLLAVEELEALRLKDMEELEQEECAQRMNISRATFQRVLNSARRKVADALVSGKAIRVEGGNFELAMRRFRCGNGHEWEVPFETLVAAPPRVCPACHSSGIVPLAPPGVIRTGGGWGRCRGKGWR